MKGILNPLLLEFPEEFTTPRLLIRGPRIGDGAAMNAAIVESLAELRPWMPWAQAVPSVEESEANTRAAVAKFTERTDLRLLVFRREDGLFLGASGLHRMDWSVPSFEIGYWLRSSCTGDGYMTEAVRGIADFAFGHLGANRVEIHCEGTNSRSRAVAERAGFRLEATLRDHKRSLSGTLCDTLIFARLRHDHLSSVGTDQTP